MKAIRLSIIFALLTVAFTMSVHANPVGFDIHSKGDTPYAGEAVKIRYSYVAHYIFMRKVCRECCDGEYPYETRRIVMITIPLLAAGFIFMVTYNYPLIRYGLVGVAVVVAIIMRKRIIDVIKNIIRLKKQKA